MDVEGLNARLRPWIRPRKSGRSVLASASVAFMVTAGAVSTSLAAPIQSFTVPGAQENVEGNLSNSFPFNIGNSTIRYQQIYGATEFSALGEPFFITEILFRPDRINGNAFSSTLSNIQINLSTTTKPVNASAAPTANSGLSATFADNVGADDTVVYSGQLTLSSTDTPTSTAASPRIFDLVIPLMTPFFYDPDLGNLLLDVRNFGGGFTTSFDSQSMFQDSVSRLFASNADPARGVNAATGTRDTMGLVTRFTIQEIPEPGITYLLFAAALMGLRIGARRCRRLVLAGI